MTLRLRLLSAVLGASVVTGTAVAQNQAWHLNIAPRGDNAPIKVDGELDDVAWRGATVVTPFTQVEPVEGAKPSHDTILRLCYDRDYFYLAVECRETKGQVRARLMDRDANLDPDDRVEFWIDTFNDRRFAYWFQIGAAGSRGDALIGGGFNKSWDGIWYGEAKITERGWQAEVAIPFKTIAFAEGGQTWGFNVRRLRKANDEEMRWANPLAAYQFFSIATGGTIGGLSGMRQGIGLDVVPYFKAATKRDRRERKHTNALGDAGLDLNYRLSPSLNLRVTTNTDFAETEVDTRRQNLTRFPLFFPERRDFFLEDSGLFSFGTSGTRSSRNPAVMPFFSRRMGRGSDGSAVPILVGAKLSGRIDDWNLGVLQIVQDENTDADGEFSDRRVLGVTRVSKNVGQESSVGVIFTNGKPTDVGDAYTGGVDFRYQDSNAFGTGRRFIWSGYWVGSFNSAAGGNDGAYSTTLSYNDRLWSASWTENHVEGNFDPELGFVRRTGIREHRLSVSKTWRVNGDTLRRWQMRFFPRYTTNESGDKDSYQVFFRPMELTFSTDDRIEYDVRRTFWRLPDDFEIHDGITIPRGDYTYTQHSIEYAGSQRRSFFVDADLTWGGFYNGNITTVQVDPTVILGKNARVGLSYEQNRVALDQGSFTTHTWSGRVDFSFTPWLSWKNLVQYDSNSKNLGAQTRVRWILEPGQELFLVGLFAWEKADHDAPFLPTTQESAMKLVYTIRF